MIAVLDDLMADVWDSEPKDPAKPYPSPWL